MKKLIIICLLVCVGCESLPPRSQIRTGMTINQVDGLYDRKIREVLDEQATEKCVVKTYRYWFQNPDKNPFANPLPYLLTFQSCRLPNYEAVQKEREGRIEKFNELLKIDPNLQMEMETFYKENRLDSEDRMILIESMALNIAELYYPPLPQCVTDETLIKIAFDQSAFNSRARTYRASSSDSRRMQLQQQQQQHIWDTQRMQHQQEFERMQRK